MQVTFLMVDGVCFCMFYVDIPLLDAASEGGSWSDCRLHLGVE